MKTPMTQNFINNYLNYDDDFTLSKSEFDELYKDKIRTEYFYQHSVDILAQSWRYVYYAN